MDPEELNRTIKSLALAQGFCACGVSPAGYLEQDDRTLRQWVAQGRHGRMDYMARNQDKRADVRQLVPGARNVISLAHTYLTGTSESISRRTGVARYALGEDYHRVLKDKMHALCAEVKKAVGEFSYRVFTDSAPVAERRIAERAGLGWIGKSSALIVPGAGSYVFLSEIVTDLDIAPDRQRVAPRCGACRRCRMACPTGAIDEDGTIDARRCLSYATIELKDTVPPSLAARLNGRVYGCDACLDACPWNRSAATTDEPRLQPLPLFQHLQRKDWLTMPHETFERELAASAIQRAGLDKIRDTIRAADRTEESPA